MLGLMFYCVDFEFWNALLDLSFLRLFNDGSDNTALLSWFLLKIRSVRILDTTVCSGSLVWLFSPAWDAVKLTLPGCWLHLYFRGHWPYQFRSNNGSCSKLAPGPMFDNFLPIPDAESLPFYPLVLKANLKLACVKPRTLQFLPPISSLTAVSPQRPSSTAIFPLTPSHTHAMIIFFPHSFQLFPHKNYLFPIPLSLFSHPSNYCSDKSPNLS